MSAGISIQQAAQESLSQSHISKSNQDKTNLFSTNLTPFKRQQENVSEISSEVAENPSNLNRPKERSVPIWKRRKYAVEHSKLCLPNGMGK